MSRDSTISKRLQRVGIASLCVLLGGCGAMTDPGARTNKHEPLRPVNAYYSVLTQPGPSGISVIAPLQIPAAKLTPSHPIWVTLPPSHHGGAARPIISSARQVIRAGSLRIWLAKNTGGGICMLAFNPGDAPDPKHDHSLLVFCGGESTLGSGALTVQPWVHGNYFVVGVVPNGVRAVIVHLANGEHRDVAVVDNSYHTVVPVRMDGVTFPVEA
jgi:hypothetical protein